MANFHRANCSRDHWSCCPAWLVVALLCMSVPAFAQPAADSATRTLRGADVPLNKVVDTLFDYFWAYRDWGREEWAYFLHHTLLITPNSECATIIETSMEENREIDIPMPGFQRLPDKASYERAQLAVIKARARALGRVYWLMRSELVRNQCKIEALDQFMESTVRASITLSRPKASDEPFAAEVVERSFQEAKREIQETARRGN